MISLHFHAFQFISFFIKSDRFIRLTHILTFSPFFFLLHFYCNSITAYISFACAFILIKIPLQLIIFLFDIVNLPFSFWKMIDQLAYFGKCVEIHLHFMFKQANVDPTWVWFFLIIIKFIIISIIIELLWVKSCIWKFPWLFIIFIYNIISLA